MCIYLKHILNAQNASFKMIQQSYGGPTSKFSMYLGSFDLKSVRVSYYPNVLIYSIIFLPIFLLFVSQAQTSQVLLNNLEILSSLLVTHNTQLAMWKQQLQAGAELCKPLLKLAAKFGLLSLAW